MKFTEEQRQEIAQRYLMGESPAVIAKEFGCSQTYPCMLAEYFKFDGSRAVRITPPDVGGRVQLNETFPYGGHGRLGTVIGATNGHYKVLTVQFDDNQKHLVKYARSYFDFLDGVPKR